MESMGIMQQIRQLLSQGRSSREVIEMGFSPGTVYKVQHQLARSRASPEESPAAREHHGKSSLGLPRALKGHLAVVQDREGESVGLWHLEGAVSCPDCGESTVHWQVCPLCNRLFPADRYCPEDSPARQEGFLVQELLDVVKE